MSGGRLVLPSTDPVLTSAGLLNVGATLTVYATGTTTLATIYADVGLTTPIANPQTSNSAGRFYTQSTQICVDATAAYDVTLALTDGETFTYTQVYALGAAPTITGYAPLASPAFTGTPTGPTPAANDSSSKIATTAFVAAAISAINVFPSGQVGQFFMSSLPGGWLLCDGSAVSRTTYASLFGTIGTTYGAGNGTTTFNLPNCQGYFLRGLNTSGSGPDSGRSPGSTQTDALQGHIHRNGSASNNQALFVYTDTTTDMPGLATGNPNQNAGGANVQGVTSVPITDGTNGTPRTSTETRPVNLAIVIAIKT